MVVAPTSVYALSEEQLDMFAQNDILFYDPDGGCGSSSGVVTVLEGKNVAEKVWNWFASAGIAKVSDNPNVISGVIGNLMNESGGNTFNMNPFIVSKSGYYGLYQAGGGRANSLKKAFADAGMDHLWGTSLSSASEADINKAVDVTLTHLTTADDGSFRTFVSRLGEVDADKPEDYSDMFLVTVERAVGGDSPILDSGAKKHSNGGNYQAAAKRRENAVSVYNAFSGNSGAGSVTEIQNDTREVMCYSGSGELITGGMTLAEGRQFMQAYRDIKPRNYGEPGAYLDKWKINNVSGCQSDLENCVAFVQYFICEYAKVCMGLPDGKNVVGRLLGSGKGFVDGGTTPRPYAIFSTTRSIPGLYGSGNHTGVVLGVDTDRGKIVIGEAGCGASYDWTNAHEYDLSKFTDGSFKYAYADGLIGI